MGYFKNEIALSVRNTINGCILFSNISVKTHRPGSRQDYFSSMLNNSFLIAFHYSNLFWRVNNVKYAQKLNHLLHHLVSLVKIRGQGKEIMMVD